VRMGRIEARRIDRVDAGQVHRFSISDAPVVRQINALLSRRSDARKYDRSREHPIPLLSVRKHAPVRPIHCTQR
jgi:hypothetical protein